MAVSAVACECGEPHASGWMNEEVQRRRRVVGAQIFAFY